uniref:G-protein coupled receptors family 1 profile domain-containing protein n=1 Tax=Astyanax mexicanus TaxID=7994 RepID=W5LT05_ASTMX
MRTMTLFISSLHCSLSAVTSKPNCSSNCRLTHDFPVCIANSAVLGLCFVLGVPGNIAVLVMLVRRLKEKNFTHSLMLSLAVSDLLTLLPLPVWIWAFLNSWIFGSIVCKIISYVQYWGIFCSVFCVTLMSIQRYMQVLHPQAWAKLGDKGQMCLLAVIWILSGLLASYSLIQRDIGCDQHGFQFCFQKFSTDTEKVITLSLEILLFLICFFMLVVFYYRLHRGVKESQFFISSSRMTKLVKRIIAVFFILYILLPFANFLIIIAVLLENHNLSSIADYCAKVSKALTLVNSCVNPFLYAFSLQELRCPFTLAKHAFCFVYTNENGTN